MGVTQRSNLVHFYFLIFINDIVNLSNLLKLSLFADDTSLYLSDCNEFNPYNIMSADFVEVCIWVSANKVALFIDRTVCLYSEARNSEY